MSEERSVTIVKSQIACAMIEMEAMIAENKEREMRGESLAYNGDAFTALIDKYGLGWNTVVSRLNEGR